MLSEIQLALEAATIVIKSWFNQRGWGALKGQALNAVETIGKVMLINFWLLTTLQKKSPSKDGQRRMTNHEEMTWSTKQIAI